MTWNPDAIAPPCGDVYTREAKPRSSWWLVAAGAGMLLLALAGLQL